MAFTMDDIDKIMKKSKPKILKRLELDEMVMAELESVDVIPSALKSDLEGLPRVKMTTKFLDNLTRGPVERFLNFCKVMHENGRTNILEDMGVRIEDVLNQIAPTTVAAVPAQTPHSISTPTVSDQAQSGQIDIWDRNHPQGDKLVIFDPMNDVLNKKTPAMKVIVELSDVWARLKGYEAIDMANINRIKKDATNEEQVEKLINFLTKQPMWCVHAFFKCLAETSQTHVISHVLGPEAAKKYPAN